MLFRSLVDNQMWGRAAMLVEEMGDEWGRVSFRLDREFIVFKSALRFIQLYNTDNLTVRRY